MPNIIFEGFSNKDLIFTRIFDVTAIPSFLPVNPSPSVVVAFKEIFSCLILKSFDKFFKILFAGPPKKGRTTNRAALFGPPKTQAAPATHSQWLAAWF